MLDQRDKRRAAAQTEECVNALFRGFEAADPEGDGILSVEEQEQYRQRVR